MCFAQCPIAMVQVVVLIQKINKVCSEIPVQCHLIPLTAVVQWHWTGVDCPIYHLSGWSSWASMAQVWLPYYGTIYAILYGHSVQPYFSSMVSWIWHKFFISCTWYRHTIYWSIFRLILLPFGHDSPWPFGILILIWRFKRWQFSLLLRHRRFGLGTHAPWGTIVLDFMLICSSHASMDDITISASIHIRNSGVHLQVTEGAISQVSFLWARDWRLTSSSSSRFCSLSVVPL